MGKGLFAGGAASDGSTRICGLDVGAGYLCVEVEVAMAASILNESDSVQANIVTYWQAGYTASGGPMVASVNGPYPREQNGPGRHVQRAHQHEWTLLRSPQRR